MENVLQRQWLSILSRLCCIFCFSTSPQKLRSYIFPGFLLDSRNSLFIINETVAYFLNTFWTTVTLVLQLCASPLLAEQYTFDRIDLVKLAGLLVSGLYIFELINRSILRLPILIHHFCTLFATVLIVCTLQKTQHPALAALALLWLFHASTEQSIFIGLIMYRFRCSKALVQRVLYFSAVQSLYFAVSIYLYFWWGLKLARNNKQAIDIAFSVLFVITLSALMITQGCLRIVAAWSIARGMDKKEMRSSKESKLNSVSDSESV
ncbi:hypothetical protein B0H19DRAFT_1255585 [Mycena capillaripes]|nr:hypothetical protein B0H19DRAFT_1255585 [Mycena capillaripes]